MMLTFEVDPQIVGVEDFELAYGLEVLHVLRRHLRNLEQLDIAVVVDESTAL